MINNKKRALKVISLIILIMLFLFINSSIKAAGIDGTTIVINPGHGGEWTGCVNGAKKLIEKDITLKIGNYLRDYLKQYYDVKVIMTHDGKTFPNNDAGDLAARAMIARNNNADLYVSLHIDDTTDKSVQGATVYITSRTELSKYKEGMTRLGNLILDNLNKLGIKRGRLGTNGIVSNKLCESKEPKFQYYDGSQADYYGDIRYAMKGDTDGLGPDLKDGSGIPTVLIEHCYINNSYDVQFVDSDADLKRLAEADGAAIVQYLGLKLPKEVISSMTIDKQSANLLEGETIKINASVGPSTAPNKTIKWSSSNNDVATVDDNGNVEAISTGKAIITATSEGNPNISKQVAINVEKEEVKFEEQNKYAIIGREKTLNAKISPSWIENKNVVWESDNSKIKVSQDGKLTIEEAGTAKIKVTWTDKNLSDEIEITAVEISSDSDYRVEEYSLNTNNYISKIGEKVNKNDFMNNIITTGELEAKLECNQDNIGTGTKVQIIHKPTGITLEEFTCLVYGDIDGNGIIDAVDLLKIRRYLLGKDNIEGIYFKTMDTFKDDVIDARDLLKVRRTLLGKDSIEL